MCARHRRYVSVPFHPDFAYEKNLENTLKSYCEEVLLEGVVKGTVMKHSSRLVFECEGVDATIFDRLGGCYADYLGAVDIGAIQAEFIYRGIAKKLPFSLMYFGGYGLSPSSLGIEKTETIADGWVKYGFYKDDMVVVLCKVSDTGGWNVAFGITAEYHEKYEPILVAPLYKIGLISNNCLSDFKDAIEKLGDVVKTPSVEKFVSACRARYVGYILNELSRRLSLS